MNLAQLIIAMFIPMSLHRYWTNFYFFSWFYRFKAGMLKLLHPGKPIMIAELEAEPWTTAGIPNTPIDEQFKTMSMDHFNTIVAHAARHRIFPAVFVGRGVVVLDETARTSGVLGIGLKQLFNN